MVSTKFIKQNDEIIYTSNSLDAKKEVLQYRINLLWWLVEKYPAVETKLSPFLQKCHKKEREVCKRQFSASTKYTL